MNRPPSQAVIDAVERAEKKHQHPVVHVRPLRMRLRGADDEWNH